MKKVPIAVAFGDGIGPEIMEATLSVLEAAGASLELNRIEIGEKEYKRGFAAGIDPASWDVIRASKAFLKAPITTPQGGGFKSLNVTIRTSLGLFANVRPCVAYAPFVKTKHPGMDVVIVRENEEDLYTGIEYRQSQQTYHALKIISRPGCEKIVRYAFEFAKSNKRKKVTCFTKDNILKLSDGLFHKVFDEIAKEYPTIENEHWIIDIGAAKLADTPENFDVIVMPNLYGDILSDVAAQIAGSVGLAGSANIGKSHAMFEAIHGSAPRRARQNLANPSGLLMASVMMLVHIGDPKTASLIHNAWLKTLEEGIHTYDIFNEKISKVKVGTKEFAKAVIERLGQIPSELKSIEYSSKHAPFSEKMLKTESAKKQLVGVDVFVDFLGEVQDLAAMIKESALKKLPLAMIANRGVKVWPEKHPETHCIDTYRLRFLSKEQGNVVTVKDIGQLLENLANAKVDFVGMENLYTFDGLPGYTVSQDEQ